MFSGLVGSNNMKLYISAASPFARKCSIMARETKIISQIQEIALAPLDNPQELLAANPIAQVPALLLNDGRAIINSPLICDYLNQIAPQPISNSLDDKRLESFSDGIMEMAVKIAFERRKPTELQSDYWIERWKSNIIRAMEMVEGEFKNSFESETNIGQIALVCALSYIEFRHQETEWKQYHPNLVKLQDKLEARASFAETRPK